MTTATAIRERPIIFSGDMVSAILEGCKTQTRRVVKPQPTGKTRPDLALVPHGLFLACRTAKGLDAIRCPYGQAGQRLWVRETWRPWCWRGDNPIVIELKADGYKHEADDVEPGLGEAYEQWYERIARDATDQCIAAGLPVDEEGAYFWKKESDCPIRWQTPLFMPRWASRITLEIVNVRVERVQEISEEDALAEGCYALKHKLIANKMQNDEEVEIDCSQSARTSFWSLWNSINAKRGFDWKSNPWVWVVEFRRINQ